MRYRHFDNSRVPFYDFFQIYSNTLIPANWHDELEILFAYQGDCQYVVDGRVVDLKDKEIFIINPRLPHYRNNEHGNTTLFVNISNEFLISNGFGPINGTFQEKINDPMLWKFFVEFYMAYYSTEKYREVNVRIATLKMMRYIFENYYTPDPLIGKHKNIDEILRFLNDNYTENFTLQELADRFNYSKCHLATLFKRGTDFTITEYVNSLRCNYADSLLKNSELKIQEIAEMCGFGTTAYFNKVYKARRHQSPSETRVQYKIFLKNRTGLGKPLSLVQDTESLKKAKKD